MARVLICDDSTFMRMVIKKILVANGHEVIAEAGDGLEAVRMFRLHKPDLVTMDITMPNMDGIEAVRVIHEEEPLARIIMVTAIGQREVVLDAIKAGASDFVVKPFDEHKVVATINNVLEIST